MCGIVGLARREPQGVGTDVLLRMIAAVRHRGPDGYGVFTGPQVGLGHARLSIIDVSGGAQPLTNEDGRIAITFNGEIFNYIELREELVAAGHTFRTRSDTEVLVHAYEEWGLRPSSIGSMASSRFAHLRRAHPQRLPCPRPLRHPSAVLRQARRRPLVRAPRRRRSSPAVR